MSMEENGRVTYEGETQFNVRRSVAPSGLTNFLITRGWVRSQQQATMLLVGIAAAAVVVTLGMWLLSPSNSHSGQREAGPLIPITVPSGR